MTLRTRIIPALLLDNSALVKTTQFRNPQYIGDPVNTVKIFNELEVDELVFLDISASTDKRGPNIPVLREIADECFMPLAYGGGISTIDQAREIFEIGFEKIVLNTATHIVPNTISLMAEHFGAQAVVASIDVKRSFLGRYRVWTSSGKVDTKKDPIDWAVEVENLGAGEILLTSIDKEGTWSGFDLDLIECVSDAVSIPVIAHGGAGNLDHISAAVNVGRASAVAVGSMLLYQQKSMGVLVNFPDKELLDAAIHQRDDA